jgi:hypothetical protein
MQPSMRPELRLGRRVKPLRIEELAANAVVKRLDKSILGRLTALDEEQLDVVLFRSKLHELRSELRAVVRFETGSSPP